MLNVPNVFTQGAMKALVQAQISAASMGHEKMGSGHLLCGLCRVDLVAVVQRSCLTVIWKTEPSGVRMTKPSS